MRTAVAYTSARVLLFAGSAGLLYLIGARGLLLLMLAFLVSGIVSYVLLSGQRDRMSAALAARRERRSSQRVTLRARLEAGARAEDSD